MTEQELEQLARNIMHKWHIDKSIEELDKLINGEKDK